MRRSILLLLVVALTQFLSAQNDDVKNDDIEKEEVKKEETRGWFNFQVAQHIGINQWSNASYANDGFPTAALTELRGACNIYIPEYYIGVFADMSVGIMPAPQMKTLSLDRMPTPHSGTQYYLRDILSESGNGSTSAHFKMTFGLFGKIPVSEKLTCMPYFGIGFLTMPKRRYEIILKEHGSNMQYHTVYSWNYNEEDGTSSSLGYLNGRLNFNYKFSDKLSLLMGLEYTWFFSTLDFYGKYSNTFNENIERDFSIKGDKMNMLGISMGISFM